MSKPKRLHPAAVIENLIKNISSFIEVIIGTSVIIFASTLSKVWIIGLLSGGLVLYVIYAILSWLRFTYYIHNDELRIEQGVLARRKTYIPLERIQSVQISAGIVQRIFGLVKLEVQTAGGGNQAEASLPAITKAQALELQEQLRLTINENVVEEQITPSKTEKKLTTKDLMIAATTSNGIGIVLVGGLALLSQINQFLPDEDIYTRLGKYLMSYAEGGILVYVLGIIFIFLLAWLLSILGTVITMGGFKITRYEDRLLIERGLIEKQQINIPIKRIQAVKIGESILRQPFGLATIHVINAGHRDKTSGDTVVIFPILPAKDMRDFLETFLPEFQAEENFNPLASGAKTRYRWIFTIPVLLMVTPVIILVKYGFLALILPLIAYFWGIKQYQDGGWQISGDQIAIRQRIMGLNTFLVKRSKVQSLELQQNPLQKRKNLKALVIKTASSIGGTTISLKGIEAADGDKIMAWFRKDSQLN